MKYYKFLTRQWIVFTVMIVLITFFLYAHSSPKDEGQQGNNYEYICVDSTRSRSFGLDMMDVTGDGYMDIVAGKFFYRNPGGDMKGKWERTVLDTNVDGMLFINVDGDARGDIIATSLPDVYWFEAKDKQGKAWTKTKIGELPVASHKNGQGYLTDQIIPGGKEEVLLATGEGIYYLVIPEKNPENGNWLKVHAVPDASDEGFGTGDIDDDGLKDIVAGVRKGKNEGSGMVIRWYKNPGNKNGNWESYALGTTKFDADRILLADFNNNGKNDVVITEERWPGKQPDASLYLFKQPADPTKDKWEKQIVVTQYSMNNLDVGDMDGDGNMDIVTAEHKGPDLEVQVWRNDGKANFTKQIVDTGKESHLGARIADLDGNGAPDIVSIGWDQEKYLHLWKNVK
jgi:hypothetical protein